MSITQTDNENNKNPYFLINDFLYHYSNEYIETLKNTLYSKNILIKDYDEENMLLLYTKFNTSIKTELQRECRSLVLDKNTFKIVSYSCETPLINNDAYNYLNYIYQYNYNYIDDYDIVSPCFEGSLISIFYNNNKWYISTRKNIIINSDDNNPHYLMFINTLKKANYDNFDIFCQTLDNTKSYYYVLIHHQNTNVLDYSSIFGNEYMKLSLIARDSILFVLGHSIFFI